MNAKIIKKVPEKYVTTKVFEKHMRSVAVSFQTVLNTLSDMRQEAKEDRQNITMLNHSSIRNERSIDDIQTRVENLENNTNIKMV